MYTSIAQSICMLYYSYMCLYTYNLLIYLQYWEFPYWRKYGNNNNLTENIIHWETLNKLVDEISSTNALFAYEMNKNEIVISCKFHLQCDSKKSHMVWHTYPTSIWHWRKTFTILMAQGRIGRDDNCIRSGPAIINVKHPRTNFKKTFKMFWLIAKYIEFAVTFFLC